MKQKETQKAAAGAASQPATSSTPLSLNQDISQTLAGVRELAALPPAARSELRASVELVTLAPGELLPAISPLDFVAVLSGSLALKFAAPTDPAAEPEDYKQQFTKLTLKRGDAISEFSRSELAGDKQLREMRAGGQKIQEGRQAAGLGAGARLLRIKHSIYANLRQVGDQVNFKLFSEEEMKKSEQLLYECVPLLQNYTSSLRDKCMRYFIKKVSPKCDDLQHFFPNDYLLRQDERAQKAYIIEKGDIQLLRKRTVVGPQNTKNRPPSISTHTDGFFVKEAEAQDQQDVEAGDEGVELGAQSPQKHKKSQNANIQEIKLGLLGDKSWVGEDSILQQVPLKYSVVAVDKVTVYQISEEYLQKIPRETKVILLKRALEQKDYIKKRYQELCEASSKIERERPLINESLNHIGKAYPIASEQARKVLQKIHLQNSNFNHKLVMVQKNARVQNLEHEPFYKKEIALEEHEKKRLDQLHRFFFYDKKKQHEKIENMRKNALLKNTASFKLQKMAGKHDRPGGGRAGSSQPPAIPILKNNQSFQGQGSRSFIITQQEANPFEIRKHSATETQKVRKIERNWAKTAIQQKNLKILQNERRASQIEEEGARAGVVVASLSPRGGRGGGEGASNFNTLPAIRNNHNPKIERPPQVQRATVRTALGARSELLESRSLNHSKLGRSKLVPKKDIPLVGYSQHYKKEQYRREVSAFQNFPLSAEKRMNRLNMSLPPGGGERARFIRPAFNELLPSKSGGYSLGRQLKF